MHNELEEFVDMAPSPYPEVWQRAVVSGADRIFPPENQLRAWKEAGVEIDLLPDAPHFPDLQRVLDRYVINKELVSRRFADACGSYSENSPVQKDVARKLWSLTANHLAIKQLVPTQNNRGRNRRRHSHIALCQAFSDVTARVVGYSGSSDSIRCA